MKVKIKATGEITEVVKLRSRENKNSSLTYYYEEWDTNIAYDADEIEELNYDDIDWRYRRCEIAKEVLAQTINIETMDKETSVKLAIAYADELIKQLKETEK